MSSMVSDMNSGTYVVISISVSGMTPGSVTKVMVETGTAGLGALAGGGWLATG